MCYTHMCASPSQRVCTPFKSFTKKAPSASISPCAIPSATFISATSPMSYTPKGCCGIISSIRQAKSRVARICHERPLDNLHRRSHPQFYSAASIGIHRHLVRRFDSTTAILLYGVHVLLQRGDSTGSQTITDYSSFSFILFLPVSLPLGGTHTSVSSPFLGQGRIYHGEQQSRIRVTRTDPCDSFTTANSRPLRLHSIPGLCTGGYRIDLLGYHT